jgi:hypothetical protein
MKRLLRIFLLAGTALCLESCYEKFVSDAPESTVCFAVAKPLRTVIANRDNEIYVGVSIAGKREVDMNDWAKFQIDASLLDGTALTLLPASYYVLSDPETFRVRKSNLPVADVKVTFTDAFYDDPKTVGTFYALPLRITESSLDGIVAGKESTVVAIKYISSCHGTYYVKGTVSELDAPGGNVIGIPQVYANKDLSRNATRNFATRSVYAVSRPGVANLAVTATESVLLTVGAGEVSEGVYDVAVSTDGGNIAITDGSGKYYPKVGSNVNNKESDNSRFEVTYCYSKEDRYYKVEETMVLRQDPQYDLRVETW